MIRTALYIRVSTEEQAIHGLSLEAQDAVLSDYANKNDLVIVGRYVDEGITARKKMANRKALMHLLDDVRAGKIDLIIFTKLDRWFRNIYDYHRVQEVLEQNKVHWKTVLEDYDTSTATGRLHINIMLSIAQDEADRTSERIKVVFENKVKNGGYLNQKTPFGYIVKDSKVLKDESKKEIVDDMFRQFFECQSIRGTLTYIQKTYGIHFEQKSFRNIFRNTLYCGEYRGVKEFCDPYITREQFDDIQRIMKEKNVKRTPSGLTYIFTGMLICPYCGKKLGSRYNFSGKEKKKIPSYGCPTRQKSGTCDFKPIILEKTVEEYLFNNVLSELDKYEREHTVKAAEKKQKKNTDKAIEKIRKKLSKLKDLYVNDMIDIDEYKRDYDDLNKQLLELEESKDEVENPVDVEAIKKLLSKSTEDIYQTLTAEDRRKFWRSFIDKIIVNSRNDMKIIFLRKNV